MHGVERRFAVSNVISIGCTCEYLIERAARHRRAGRFDEAMALLWKAKNQFGVREDVEMEMAAVYEELGCDEEAARSYLRVVRLEEERKAEALFHLALNSYQSTDLSRAKSYYQHFASMKQACIDREVADMLGKQIMQSTGQKSVGRKQRARELGVKAAAKLQEGKIAAAKRSVKHALRLKESAKGYTLLACCHLLCDQAEDAVQCAGKAKRLSWKNVQNRCVLADAYAAAGDMQSAWKEIRFAALLAHDQDDLLAAAVESAKYGDDVLTLKLTGRILRREPYHVRGMLLRACALTNMGRNRQAAKLFGRVSGLMPEDTVSAYYYRLVREGKKPSERLKMGLDVPREEAILRAEQMMKHLSAEQDGTQSPQEDVGHLCRICDWAFRSPYAGAQTKTLALVLLCTLDEEQARETLLDALMNSSLSDSFKKGILQLLTAKEGFKPYIVDIDGRLVRLAAGGVSSKAVAGTVNSRIVQLAADVLAPAFPDAPGVMLKLFLAYLDRYEHPKKRHEQVCAAALECVYHMHHGRQVDVPVIARRWGVSPRLCRVYTRRLKRSEKP